MGNQGARGAAAKKVVRRYLEIWEFGDVELLEEVLHEDYCGHPSSGERDIEGVRARILAFHDVYKSPSFRIEDQLAEEDRVASRIAGRAIRLSDGVPVTFLGQNISRIADGKIIEEWMVFEVVPA